MARGYSMAALTESAMLLKGLLTSAINLNDLTGLDGYGNYYCTAANQATIANNYPVEGMPGTLEVLPTLRGDAQVGCVQRFQSGMIGSPRMFIRVRENPPGSSGTGFSPWREMMFADDIYKAIYPVGICIDFDNKTNPNSAFPGTTWTQISDGRTVRTSLGINETDPNPNNPQYGVVGALKGSNEFTVDEENLPRHSHSIAQHTHDMNHTHGINHQHATATTGNNGSHRHNIRDSAGNPALNGGGSEFRMMNTGATPNNNGGIIDVAGEHNHTVIVPAYTGSTTSQNVGATALGGPTTTGDVGLGRSILHIGAVHYYARWKRTA